jgi:RHS repeat-associated protein
VIQNGSPVQISNYYSFGGTLAESAPRTDQGKQPYKFNGKELDRLNGKLDLYDYGAGMYDPATVRFTTMDPLAEKYYSISPYAYCNNNPVNAVDPDGTEIVFTVGKQRFTYNHGILTEKSTGRGVKYSQDSHLGRVVNAYNKALFSSDPSIANQVIDLIKSELTHEITGVPSSDGQSAVIGGTSSPTVTEANAEINAGYRVGTKTRFNFSETAKNDFKKMEGVPNSDFTTVVHELQHQHDYETGNMADGHNMGSSAKNPAEVRAVNNENKARKIEGLPFRYTYGGEEIDPKKIIRW